MSNALKPQVSETALEMEGSGCQNLEGQVIMCPNHIERIIDHCGISCSDPDSNTVYVTDFYREKRLGAFPFSCEYNREIFLLMPVHKLTVEQDIAKNNLEGYFSRFCL